MKLLGGTYNKTKRSSFYLPDDNVYLGNVSYNLGYFYYSTKNRTLSETASFQDFYVSFNNNKIYGITDVGDAIFQYKINNPEDVSTITLVDTLTTSTQDSAPSSVFFSTDGAKAYILGDTNNTIYQYTLSTPWDITSGSYSNKSFSVSSQDTTPTGIAFSVDGSKCYVVGATNGVIFQYTLSTAWDISTTSYSNKSFSVRAYDTSPQGISFKSDGTKFYLVGAITNIVYQFTLITDWDISTAISDLKVGAVASQDTTPNSIFFKPDGTKVYVAGATNNTIYQYTLSTAWDVSTLSYDNKSLNVSGWDSVLTCVFLKSDGTKLYFGGDTNDRIRSYTLKTAWDISTAYYQLNSNPQESTPWGLDFSSDGTKAYIVGSGSDAIYQYTLDTPWDTNTAFYSGKSFSVLSQDTTAVGVKFSSDGTKAFIIGDTNNAVYQYTLSTAWDISTASYASKSLGIGTQDILPTDLAFSSDGTKLYMVGDTNNTIYQYTLSTAWDLTGATYATKSFSVNTQSTGPAGIAFSSDGTKFYLSTFATANIFQYGLTTAWDISTASYASKSLLFSSYDTTAVAVSINSDGTKLAALGVNTKTVFSFTLSTAYDLATASYNSPESYSTSPLDTGLTGVAFNNDGTLMYTNGDGNDRVFQYKLSTAWNVSTAIPFRQIWGIGSQEPIPHDLTFSTDGTKAYVSGASAVFQYNLSSAWNISTAIYASKSFTTSTQDTASRAIAFSSDGTIFYMAGQTTDSVYQYTLSTAWDISTASYASKSLGISAREITVTGIYFKSDGTSLYVMGDTSDRVDQFNLTTAWDISTATYASKTFSISGQEANVSALFFKSDGSSFYIVGTTNDTIYQYSLTLSWDISTASYSGKSYLITNLEATSSGLFFSSDGTSCYILGNTSDTINQLNLAIPWDISSANIGYLNVNTQDTSILDLCFNSLGTRLYVIGNTNDRIYQYNLSVPWNVGSATFATSVLITKQETFPTGIFLSDNGTRIYVVGGTNDTIYSYILNTPYELSSIYIPASPSLNDTSVRDICFNSSGSKFYITGATGQAVYQWNLSTDWDVTTATYPTKSFSVTFQGTPTGVFLNSAGTRIYALAGNLFQYDLLTNEDASTAQKNWTSISTQESSASGLTFSTDGTKVYIIGQSNDTIYQYNLSIAWNINSATYANKFFGIGTLDATPTSLTFSEDGLKAFFSGSTNDRIYELILTIAWDISTAYYRKNLSVASQDGLMNGAVFGNNGLNLYIIGDSNNTIYQYNLTTAYDLFTATYSTKSFSVSSFDGTLQGLVISTDGKQIFVLGDDSNRVYQFSLSTAWDLSTAYAIFNKRYGPLGRETSPQGLTFGDSGTKLYIVGTGTTTNSTVYQFTLSSPYEVSTATYANKSYFLSFATLPTAISFNTTGTKMYALSSGSDIIREYRLATAWDVSTATNPYYFRSISTQTTTPVEVQIGDSGTKMYVASSSAIYQYTLSTPNLITSATYANKLSNFSTSYESSITGFYFKDDGSKVFVNGTSNDRVGEYTLTTPWDISTTTPPWKTLYLGGRDLSPQDIFFGDSGFKLYYLGSTNDTIYQYNLTTAYDISTATYATKTLSVGTQETAPAGLAFSSDGTKAYIVGSTSDNIRQYTLSTAWDISTGTYASKTLAIGTQDGNSSGLAFSSDGTKAYVLGDFNNVIYQYTLSTAWDISTGSYASKSISVNALETNPGGISFKPDGTKLYIIGGSVDSVYQYTLSTAWDISTASSDSKSTNLTFNDAAPNGLAFNDSGTKCYMLGSTGSNLYEYPVGTAWDASTINNGYIGILSQDTTSQAIFFKPDGTRMYMLGATQDRIFEYNLAVAWQVSTAVYSRQSITLTETSGVGVYFSSDGTKFFIVGGTNDRIYQYNMSTAWDVTTASLNSFSVSVVNDDSVPAGLAFDSTGSNVYMLGATNNAVYQYPLESNWDVRAINVGFLIVSSQDTAPEGMCFSNDGSKIYYVGSSNTTKYIYQYDLFVPFLLSSATYTKQSGITMSGYDTVTRGVEISSDGTKIYMLGSTNDSIYQFNLSTPNDVGNITFAQSRSLVPLTNDPSDLRFNNDGTKLYVISSNDFLYQFELTTAYDLSTIITGYSGATVINTQDATPTDIAFSSDGTKCYALGDGNNTIYQYTLSTPWNISSFSYASKTLAIGTQEVAPTGLTFSSDGTKCYVIGTTNNTIFQYTLSTAWDISTGSYASKSFSVAVHDTLCTGLIFNNSGTKVFVCQQSADRILEYELSTAWDISTAYIGYLNIVSQENDARGISFDNTGKKLFLIGAQNNRIIQYDLSTSYYLATAILNANSFFNISTSSVGISDTVLTNVSFNENGSKLFVYGQTNNKLYQFNVAFN
jgi:DNA-binding beta-propeller fold protein YncE